MKNILTLWMMMCLAIATAHGQNISINTTGNAAHPSALLDISGSQKGLLIPRMPSWERQTIIDPATGLLVFDNTTNSFWYFSNDTWNELGGGGVMAGPAGGDLSGMYPTPSVVKLQNLDVAFGVPFDKQVLKWDALSNNWKGRNDSLFLPYNVAYSNAGALFGITNNNAVQGSSAILGKRGAGSGITPGTTMGVWGDNSNGLGVLGTSDTGSGVYGVSFANHGVYGYSTTADFAGVKGSHANDNGIGVLGETGQLGIGVSGLGTGTLSVAGRFENTNPDALFTALDVLNNGFGAAASFYTGNPLSTSATVYVNSLSKGDGLYALVPDNGDNNAALRGIHNGGGQGVYAKSATGNAGKFMIENTASLGDAVYAYTQGKGKAGAFLKNNTSGSTSDMHEPAVLVDNNSKGIALKVLSLHSPSVAPGIEVQYSGQAYGININSTKGGLHALSTSAATTIFAENYSGGVAIKAITNTTVQPAIHGENQGLFGIGVLGRANTDLGIGVQGESNSDVHAAIVGINTGNGGGVRGLNASEFGVGVIGESGEQHGIAGQFICGNNDSEVSLGLYVLNESKGTAARILTNNNLNAQTALEIEHQGTGNFAVFISDFEDKFVFGNNGNMTAKGTLTVKGNKGIVRNSTSAQKRMETLTVDLIYFNMPQGGSTTQTVSFGTAFSSAPIVTLGNINSGFLGPCDKMTVQIKNVTTTGCTVTLYNPGVSGNPDVSGTWNLLAIGNE